MARLTAAEFVIHMRTVTDSDAGELSIAPPTSIVSPSESVTAARFISQPREFSYALLYFAHFAHLTYLGGRGIRSTFNEIA